jgi:hypothetical protein
MVERDGERGEGVGGGADDLSAFLFWLAEACLPDVPVSDLEEARRRKAARN